MKYTVKFTAKFKKDYKLALKRGYKSEKIETVIALLAEGNHQEVLISKYKDHALSGNWSGYRGYYIEQEQEHIAIYLVNKKAATRKP